MKERSHLTVVSCILMFALSLQTASPHAPIGAVVQTWHYDPAANMVTLQIVNTSHKDITAFNIAIKETYTNGRVDQHEILEEMVGKIFAAKEVQGTAREASFRKQYGDGVLHPGELRNEKMPVQAGLRDYQAVVDVVTYLDGTADSNNDSALQRIVDERKAALASEKMAIDIMQSALADPDDANPSLTAAEKMQAQAAAWRAGLHINIGDPVVLEFIARELKTANSRGTLEKVMDREAAKISVLTLHAAVKVGGPQ